MDIDLSICDSLLALCDLFGTPLLERLILTQMRVSLNPKGDALLVDAWNAFKIGAKRDDIDLAKAAIRCFGLSGYDVRSILLRNSPSHFNLIPPRYIYALMRASFDPKVCPDHTEQSRNSKDPNHPREAVHVRHLAQSAVRFSLD